MKKIKLIGISAVVLTISFLSCTESELTGELGPVITGTSTIDINTSQIPGDVSTFDQNPSEFAWQMFIGLNWPAEDGKRGVASSDESKTFSSITGENSQDMITVWQTYAHKAETFDLGTSTATLPKFDDLGAPKYTYSDQDETFVACDGSMASTTLYNNLDEASQLGLCEVNGATKTKGGNHQVLFEAKINPVEYEYIRKYNLNQPAVRSTYNDSTKAHVDMYGGTCGETDEDKKIMCLPCGDATDIGSMELKASWRELAPEEISSNKFYTQTVMVYKPNGETTQGKIKPKGCVENKVYGLVGLHIIQKTANFKEFIFSTFEHVDNFKSGLAYENNPENHGDPQYYKYDDGDSSYKQEGTEIIDSLPQSVSASDFASIPTQTSAANTAIWDMLPDNSVWKNYKLVGVQGTPINYDDRHAPNDEFTYFLANNVTETNITLRKFIGPGMINNNALDTNKAGFNKISNFTGTNYNLYAAGTKFNTGGCMGCHGVAQISGGDLSFLLLAGKNRYPEPYGLEGDDRIKAMREALFRFGD